MQTIVEEGETVVLASNYRVMCADCHMELADDRAWSSCPACGGAIEFDYALNEARLDRQLPGLWRFADLLPLKAPEAAVSLFEGNTPLIPARLSSQTGVELSWKWEGVNPTGAQKDRALCVGIAKGRELGYTSAIIGSTGSAGLSSAAYAARAGMTQVVLVSRDAPAARIIPMIALGAKVFEVDGSIEDTLDLVAAARDELGAYETSTYRGANPYQSEGAKTLGYELHAQWLEAGRVPDWLVIPVGGGGTLAAIWRAFQDLRGMGVADRLPRLVGVQPERYNGLEIAMQRGLTTAEELQEIPFTDVPPTVLVKLAHTFSHDGADALAAVRESGGTFVSISDDDAFAAQRQIGRTEGLYAEPSSTVTLTAIQRLREAGTIGAGDVVTAVLTGSGHRETHVLASETLLPERITMQDGLARIERHLAAREGEA